MKQLHLEGPHFHLAHKIHRRLSSLRRCILRAWYHVLTCSLDNHGQYRILLQPTCTVLPSSSSPSTEVATAGNVSLAYHNHHNKDPDDLVALKISLLGDCRTGKTSFLAKYVGNEKEDGSIHANGFNFMDKTLMVDSTRITYSLWEVDGEDVSHQQMPVACKDSVAILIMFDLTSRVTLNGVIKWYQEARKWNQAAIPIIVGTKFDDFIQLPIHLQWTIASQARAYAKALNATLFFSSATYNINVNKIFKFITARLFDVPWTLQRNLTIGEPIIDF